MEQRDLTKGNVMHELMRFALPFMLTSALQMFYGATDLFVVGNFATTVDVSAVSIGSQIMATVTKLMEGLTAGITIVLGQYSGAGRKQDMPKVVGTSFLLFSAIGIAVTAVLMCCKDQIVTVMNTPAQAIDATDRYLMICLMGTIFITGYNVISSIFRGLGNSKTPLVFVAVACAINVILDFVLVKYFHMGAKGAAIATVMAQAGSLLFSLLYIKRRGIGMQFTKTHIRWDGKAIKKITKVGAPIALQETLVSLSFLIITVIINTRGLVASAAVGVVEKLISFLMIPAFSMGAAVAAMVAQNYGATKLDRAKKCMWSGVEVSLAFAVVISVICWFRGDIFTSIFSNDSQVVAQAALYLKTYGLDCILVSFVFNMNGYFNGCGKSLFTMVHSLATTFCIRVPVTMLLNAMAGATLTTIGCAAPLSTLGSLILCLCYLYYLKRQLAKDKRNAFHA